MGNGVIFFWLLLIFLPTWKVTVLVVEKKIIPFYLALLYSIGIIMTIIQNGFGFIKDFGSAQGVIHLLSDPQLAILCWIHLLCFDLFVGHIIMEENQKDKNIPLPLQSTIMFFTLLFGPFGYLCFWIANFIGKKRKLSTED
ncbi:ABA4-like family protein [Shimazuella kribbensis]|uniref:ABA4-like family protein n=1 Tax=Shimazuella kribbensis TaxID=139808 RepID=UPI001FE1FA63|nr:ABA4-like family protein [Shimazuella kribbensis]